MNGEVQSNQFTQLIYFPLQGERYAFNSKIYVLYAYNFLKLILASLCDYMRGRSVSHLNICSRWWRLALKTEGYQKDDRQQLVAYFP